NVATHLDTSEEAHSIVCEESVELTGDRFRSEVVRGDSVSYEAVRRAQPVIHRDFRVRPALTQELCGVAPRGAASDDRDFRHRWWLRSCFCAHCDSFVSAGAGLPMTTRYGFRHRRTGDSERFAAACSRERTAS